MSEAGKRFIKWFSILLILYLVSTVETAKNIKDGENTTSIGLLALIGYFPVYSLALIPVLLFTLNKNKSVLLYCLSILFSIIGMAFSLFFGVLEMKVFFPLFIPFLLTFIGAIFYWYKEKKS